LPKQQKLPRIIPTKNATSMKTPTFSKIIHWISYCVLALSLTLIEIWPASQLAYGQAGSFSENGLGTIVTPNRATIFVEIADSPDKRVKGLMLRPSMAPDRGMLFLFPGLGDRIFWMKNTLIPLDILWLNESGDIIHMEAHVPICTRKDDGCPRYRSPYKSLQVLELNAGMAKKLNLAVGKRLKIDLPPMSFPY